MDARGISINLSRKFSLQLKTVCEIVLRMRKMKRLSDKEITFKIRAMNDFVVGSDSERKRVLLISGVLGADVVTRKQKDGTFRVFIPSEITN